MRALARNKRSCWTGFESHLRSYTQRQGIEAMTIPAEFAMLLLPLCLAICYLFWKATAKSRARSLSTRLPRICTQDIRLARPLGTGSFGTVYLGKLFCHKCSRNKCHVMPSCLLEAEFVPASGLWFGSRIAVKQIQSSLAPYSHEIWIGENLSHPNVVSGLQLVICH